MKKFVYKDQDSIILGDDVDDEMLSDDSLNVSKSFVESYDGFHIEEF